MKTTVTFGEIMGRLCPEGFLRLRQSLPGVLNLTFAGAEANVAASIAYLGGKSRFVTALPDNVLSDGAIAVLRGVGVDTSFIKRVDEGRLGLYFVETGANQRPSRVVYDREHSSVSLTDGQTYDWDAAFADAGWFHLTGITPSLSQCAAEASLHAVRKAKEAGLTVSCDLNFRKKLWQWKKGVPAKELARDVMKTILQYVDVLIGNEEDAGDILGIHAEGVDSHFGQLEASRYTDVAAKIAETYPKLTHIAITLRESLSATHNNWGAMLYETKYQQAHFAPASDASYQPYEIRSIVDRVGAGDSFGAALIFALQTAELAKPPIALAFAVAASCLAHSIVGDFNFSSRDEVEALMGGSASGRVVR